ncbi:MAG: hypothetical protein RLY74_726, partial [Actinomycetota bacterium]
ALMAAISSEVPELEWSSMTKIENFIEKVSHKKNSLTCA